MCYDSEYLISVSDSERLNDAFEGKVVMKQAVTIFHSIMIHINPHEEEHVDLIRL
jgi:hypothetical protein